jgi:DNA gyrase subunit B
MTEDIKKLTPYQHVRLRTPVYYGSTSLHTGNVLSYDADKISIIEAEWVPAVFTSFREILDNSLDEVVVHGYGNKIDVKFNSNTMEFEVKDNGRGIPIDWDEEHQMHKATLALSELMAGRNFDNRNNTAGMNGIGASGVNFCSEYFNVEIHRDGKKFIQNFSEGSELLPELQKTEPKITKKTGQSGTKINFKLSKTVFKNLNLTEKFVKDRLVEIAACNPKIKITFNDQPIKIKNIDKDLFAQYDTIHITVTQDKLFDSKFILVPGAVLSGDHAQTLVNNIPVFDGGTHIESFKKHFVSNLLSALEKESKRRGLTPNRSDIFESMLIFNITRIQKPEFDSQSKTRLINDDVDKWIKQTLENENTFKTIIKQHKSWVNAIYERCAARTQKREDADLAKANRKLLRAKVPKLLDANGKDRTKCILLITEGDSAKTMVSAVRDPEIYGALPLRGKILNVRGESAKIIIENQIITDLMAAIGVGLGQTAVREDLRYGKVYLAADQDPDGANITALLINFFYLHWPELFDPNLPAFFYAFQTPFIIQEKGKKRFYWYADDYQQYNSDDWKNCPKPTRAKGLGSLEEADWIHSLANPKLIPIVDDGNLSDALDLIFNSDRADDRKDWISL